jgi:phenylacetic acid degradation operon negative regulatory protein
VWITPRPGAEADAKLVLDELALTRQAMSFVANYGALGEEQDMVSAAWNLGDVAERYRHFITEFGGLDPGTPDDVLTAQIRLVHEWRRFPFLDPQLPAELLPPQWIGTRATDLFNSRHTRWRETAQHRWAELAG